MTFNSQDKVDAEYIGLRKFGDGTWSVTVRVWAPQKEFYEHPTYINLTKEEAEQRCQEIQQNIPTIGEVISTWVFIGT